MVDLETINEALPGDSWDHKKNSLFNKSKNMLSG
jgi:hypothetical protein